MESFRNSFLAKCFVTLLVSSLGLVVISPASASDGVGSEYADWIRLHLPEAFQPEVISALELAEQRGARSFDQFLASFLDELDHNVAISLASKAVEGELAGDDAGFWTLGGKRPPDSSEKLAQELRLRFVRLVADAVLARTLKGDSVSPQANFEYFRWIGSTSNRPTHKSALSAQTDSGLADGGHPSLALHLRSAAQPQGP